jgi:uroporphyrinogen decarboxylase
MERVLDTPFSALLSGTDAEVREFFRHYCRFFRDMTYDVVSFEVCITEVLPNGGALSGGRPGPIQNRTDFESYPWAEIPGMFWERATPRLDGLVTSLPDGMKAVGGVGNGVFEISEDLVGLEYLPFMQVDDPDLYADLFRRIGDLMCSIWDEFLTRYKGHFAACRTGDDLGFKSSLLTNPSTVRNHIVPQYRRVIDLIHGAGKPFLFHSCGCIFEIMQDMVGLGIDAKHSNEDAIAPFERWIEDYGDKIGLLGGFDMDFLCSQSETDVFAAVVEQGRRFRELARGYALGSGNSIPDYVPVENYLAMVRAAQEIRAAEEARDP